LVGLHLISSDFEFLIVFDLVDASAGFTEIVSIVKAKNAAKTLATIASLRLCVSSWLNMSPA